MGVDAVLQSTTPVSKGGVLTASSRGQMCYDLAALTRELQRRYFKYHMVMSLVQPVLLLCNTILTAAP